MMWNRRWSGTMPMYLPEGEKHSSKWAICVLRPVTAAEEDGQGASGGFRANTQSLKRVW